MYHVEIYVRVRRAVMVDGMSMREASRVFGLHRDTVRKMLAYSAPPGYRRQDPPRRPRLEPFTGVIDAILEADRQVPTFVRLIISLWKVLWMYHVEIYVRVRRAVMVDGMSMREASRVFGLHRDTVRKMLAYSAPPGYRRQDPPRRPRLEPFTGVIDAILEADRQVPKKQRHTAKRIFERLRDEHGFDGQYTIVKDYVRVQVIFTGPLLVHHH